jgi:anaerobic selenocysteine-containing dehydrogenase
LENIEVKKVACFFCHNNCNLFVHVRDNHVIKIEGDPSSPNKGYMCERPRFAIKWLYHPDQLKYPLKKVGERGEGKWVRISWDQALGEIAGKLKELRDRYGPECLAFIEGTYRSDMNWARSRFANLFGNPHNHFSPGTICWVNRIPIDLAIFGAPLFPRWDIGKANCIVAWGANPSEAQSGGLPWIRILKRFSKKPRPKLIVIDPRLTETARRADIWLQLRPGTDTALALSWINVIINEKLYDKDFVEKWCYGFDKLKNRVKEYPPGKVSEITWVPEEKIVESARMYAENKPASIIWGVATDQIGLNASRAAQSLAILIAITGNVDIPGGHLLPEIGPKKDNKMFIRTSMLELAEKCPPEQRKKQIGMGRFKLTSWEGWELINEVVSKVWGIPLHQHPQLLSPTPLLWRAILTGKPYPVKALITWQSNPLLWAPNTKLVYKALKSSNLELHVVLDYWLTPTAELADYVLPAASWLERPLCTLSDGDIMEWVRGGVRAIQPIGERRTDFKFFRELGVRLGQAEYWPWKTYEEVIEYRLKPLGITYEEFNKRPWTDPPKREYRKYEKIDPKTGKPAGFATPIGKVELYSTIFEKLGYDPLPYYEEPPESPIRTPEVVKEYPLILITGSRFRPMYHSEHRQPGIGSREMHPDPIMEIHSETARSLGIHDGNWVWIETRRGRIKQKARLFTGIHPRVVSIQHGWWFPEKPGEEPYLHGAFESNANVLTLDDPETLDPLTGGWCNRGLLCKVYRVKEIV